MPWLASAPSSLPPAGHSQLFFIIDFDGDVAFAHQLGFGKQNHQCQSQDDDGEHHDT